jgi:heavy metal translocating P-type ATPase
MKMKSERAMNEKLKIAVLVINGFIAVLAWVASLMLLLPQTTVQTLEFTAAIISLCFIAFGAVRSLLGRVFGIDVLASVAVLASIVAHEYLAATVVVLMLGGGEILEDYASQRATKAIQKLIEASPQTATIIVDGKEVEVKADELRLGEIVLVKPGGKIPADGVVQKGEASVNQSSITGESMPVGKTVGDGVFSGTLVELGALEISVTQVGENSTYGRIIRMVKEAEERRAPIERTADKYAKYFTPLILGLGAIVFVFTQDIIRVAALFVIACPCALTLTTPTAIVASIGNAARKGILIRNGESLEKLNDVDALVFDKTGTVTLGKPQVTQVRTLGNHTQAEVLALAATAEKCSEHPLAQAVLEKACEENLDLGSSDSFNIEPGIGVCVQGTDCHIAVGNEKMMEKHSIVVSDEIKALMTQGSLGESVIYVAKDDEIIGSVLVSDTLRKDSESIMKKVKSNGIKKTILLTGDNPQAANHVAEHVGIDEVASNQLPDEKVNRIRELKKEGYTVAMVGDGINDAPALAEADVGIAMGLSGTDVAIETAGVTLATDSLDRIPKLLRISKATIRIIKQNIAFAMLVNIVGIALSIQGSIPPLLASMIHESNALIVMINALRLLRVE